ncbi:MAG TPA: polysaccharide deacetylase family protein [Desulfobacteraceae bacterium]|nr:polysaccharide deacetylase family protein [Desulfobacteraceae bacterium]
MPLAAKSGIIALLLALPLFVISPALATVPLLLFLLLCLGAPFFPRFGFFLPIISRGKPGTNGVALTFDDGPSPESTPILLNILARYQLPATFFVVGEKAANHPELITDILSQGHAIGNHSLRHDHLLMLRSLKTLQADIHNTQEILKKIGIQPLVFRPPAGISNPRLAKVLAGEGLITVNFSCRAFDRGNRSINKLAARILDRLQPGDIIMLHDLPPYQENRSDYWQQELECLFAALRNNYTVVSLKKIIQCPVMKVNLL